jgi:hypothetical protein
VTPVVRSCHSKTSPGPGRQHISKNILGLAHQNRNGRICSILFINALIVHNNFSLILHGHCKIVLTAAKLIINVRHLKALLQQNR